MSIKECTFRFSKKVKHFTLKRFHSLSLLSNFSASNKLSACKKIKKFIRLDSCVTREVTFPIKVH
jgi:hypothetical protein